MFVATNTLNKQKLVIMSQTTDTFQTNEFLKPQRSQKLNILTILTFIGCSFGLLFLLATPAIMKFSKSMMEKSSSADLTPKQIADMRLAVENMDKVQANIVPIGIVSIIGIGLCFFGALMMRKLKKDGFWIYVAGQVIPLVGGLIILGTGQYSSFGSYTAPLIAVVFIALYASERKNMVY